MNGPVCRELFNQHKGMFMIEANDLTQGSSGNLTSDEKDSVNVVLRDYGDMLPYELRELSHSGQPYIDARGKLPADMPSNNIISKTSMGNYYGAL